MTEICLICGLEKKVQFRADNNEPVCQKCYRNYYYKPKKKECPVCKIYKFNVYITDGILCCRNCNKKLHSGICDVCKKEKPLSFIGAKHICSGCHRKNHKRKIIVCGRCNKKKEKHSCVDNQEVCESCYKKHKYNTDDFFRAKTLLRSRLNKAINGRCLAPKFKINYKAIIKYLGPCPGARDKYHIDHIIPLCHFDLTIQEDAEKAFAPENHQWLLAEENLKKGGRI